ncbi:helix-turn-helix transcriptional regulator [Micromonospora sp. NPDC050417]|uniref:helix-turn-helix transcriptional regulator n=1 Tax=Micromonospora sp. NPDC050417 TaxID=3364280 RepID=UPI00378CC462
MAFRELGASLSRRRRELELTQSELAAQVGYSRSTLAGAENGARAHHDFWQACDRQLGAGGELLGGYLRVRALVHALVEQTDRERLRRRIERIRSPQVEIQQVTPAEPAAGNHGCNCPEEGKVPVVTITVTAGATGSVHVLIDTPTPRNGGPASSVSPQGARVYSLAQARHTRATRTG